MKTDSPVARYWSGPVPEKDDFGMTIKDEFVDGKTKRGPWGFMTPMAWRTFGVGFLGLGRGQLYRKQKDGRWLKVEG